MLAQSKEPATRSLAAPKQADRLDVGAEGLVRLVLASGPTWRPLQFGVGKIWDAERTYRVVSIVRLYLGSQTDTPAWQPNGTLAWDQARAAKLERHLTALAAARDQSGRDCTRTLTEICGLCATLLSHEDGAVELATDMEPVLLSADRRRALVLACLALMLNAMQAAMRQRRPRQVWISLRRGGAGDAIATFADDGLDLSHNDNAEAWRVFNGLVAALAAEVSQRRIGEGALIELRFPADG